MSYICPKDGRPCCDDLCRSAGCFALNGEDMIEVCDHCTQMVSNCECDDEDEWTHEEDEDD